jgi:hypothetical protein
MTGRRGYVTSATSQINVSRNSLLFAQPEEKHEENQNTLFAGLAFRATF